MHDAKACTRCATVKPLDEFHKNKRSKDGYSSACKECRRESGRAYRATPEVRERTRKRSAEHYRANREKLLKRQKDRLKTPEGAAKRRAYMRKYRAANKDKMNAYQRTWAAKNPNKRSVYYKTWMERYPERVAAKHARRVKEGRFAESSQRRRARKNNAPNYAISARDLRRLSTAPCFHCGSTKNPTLDHLIPLSRGGSHGIGNLIPMCKSCNCTKHDKTFMEWRMWLIRAGRAATPATVAQDARPKQGGSS